MPNTRLAQAARVEAGELRRARELLEGHRRARERVEHGRVGLRLHRHLAGAGLSRELARGARPREREAHRAQARFELAGAATSRRRG